MKNINCIISSLIIFSMILPPPVYSQINAGKSSEEVIENLQDSLGRKDIVIEKLMSEKDILHEDITRLIKENDLLEKDILELHRKMINLDSNTYNKDSKIDKLSLQKKALVEQMTFLRQESIALSEQIKTLKEKIWDKELDVQKRVLESQAPLQEKLTILENKLKGGNENFRKKEIIINSLTNEKKKLVEELKRVKGRLVRVEQKPHMTEKDILEKIERAKKPLDGKILKLKKELDGFRAKFRNNETEARQLQMQVAARDKKVLNLQKQKKALEEEVLIVQEKFQKVEVLMQKEVEKSKAPLKAQIRALQGKLKENERLLAKKVKKISGTLEKQTENFKAQLLNIEKSFLNKLRDEKAKSQGKIKAIETKLKNAENLAQTKEKKIKAINRERNELNTKFTMIKKDRDALEQQIKDSDDKFSKRVKESEQNFESVKKPLYEKITTLEKTIKIKENLMSKNLAEQKFSFEKQIKTLNVQLKNVQGKIGVKEKNIEQLLSEKSVVQGKLGNIRQEKQKLENDLSKAQKDLKGVELSLSEKISAAKKPLQEQIGVLQQEVLKKNLEIQKKVELVKKGLLKELEFARNQIKQKEQELAEKLVQFKKVKQNKVLTDEGNKFLENEKEGLKREKKELITELGLLKKKFSLLEGSITKKMAKVKAPLEEKKIELEKHISDLQKSSVQQKAHLKSSFEKEITDLKGVLTRKNIQSTNNRYMVKKLQKEKDSMAKELSFLEKDKKFMEEELVIFKKKYNDIKSSTSQKLEETQQPLERELAGVRAQLLSVTQSEKNKIITLKKKSEIEKSSLVKKIQLFEKELEGMKITFRKKDQEIAELTKSKDSIQKEFVALKDQKNKWKQEVVQLKKSLVSAEQRVKSKNESIQALTYAKRKTEQKVLDINNQKENLKQKIKQLNQKLSKVEQLVMEKNQNVEELRKVKTDDFQQLSLLKKQAEKWRNESMNLKKSLVDTKQGLETREKNIQSLTKVKEEFRQENLGLKKQLQKLNIQLDQNKRMTEQKLNEKTAFYKKQISVLEQKMATSDKEIAGKEKHVQSLMVDKKKFKKSLNEQNVEHNQLDERLAFLKGKLQKEKENNLKKVESVRLLLEGEIQGLTAKIGRFKEEKHRLVKDLEEIKKQLTAKTNNVKHKDEVQVALIRDINALKMELKSADSNLVQKLREAQQPLESQIKQLKELLEKNQTQFALKESNIQSLIREKQTIEKQLSQEEGTQKHVEQKLVLLTNKLAKQKKNFEQSLEKLTQVKKKMEQEVLDINKQKENLKQEIKKLNQKLSKTQQLVKEKNQSVEELRKVKIDSFQKVSLLQKKSEQWQNEVVNLKKALVDSKQGLETKEKNIQLLTDAKKETRQEILFLKSQVKKLGMQLDQNKHVVEQQLNEKTTFYTEQISALKNKVIIANKEIFGKEKHLQSLIVDKEKLEKSLSEQNVERNQLDERLVSLKNKFQEEKARNIKKVESVRVLLEGEIQGLRAKISGSKEEKYSLVKDIKEVKKQLTIKTNNLLQKEAEQVALIRDIKKLKIELKIVNDSLPQKIKKAQQPLESQIEQLEKLAGKNQAQFILKTNDIQKLTKEKQVLEKQLGKKKDTQKYTEQKLLLLTNKVAKQKKIFEQNLEKEKNLFDNKLAGLIDAKIKDEKIYKNLEKEKAALEEKLLKAQSALQSQKQSEKNTQERVSQVAKNLQILEVEKKSLLKKFNSMKSALETKENILKVKEQKQMDLVSRIENFKKILNKTEQSIPEKIMTVQKPLEAKIEQLQREIVFYQKKMGILDDKVRQLTANLEKETLKTNESKKSKEKLLKEIKTKKNVLKIKEQKQMELVSRIENFKKILNKTEQSIPEKIMTVQKPLELKIVQLQKEIVSYQKKMTILNGRVKQLTENFEKEAVKTHESAKSKDKFLKEIDEITQEKKMFQEGVNALQVTLNQEQSASNQHLAKVKNSFEGEVKDLMEKLKQSKISEKILEQELVSIKNTLNNLQQDLEKKEDHAQKSQSKIKILRNELQSIRVDIPKQISKNRMPLEAEIQRLQKILVQKNKQMITQTKAINQLKESKQELAKELAIRVKEAQVPLQEKIKQLTSQLKQDNIEKKNINMKLVNIQKQFLDSQKVLAKNQDNLKVKLDLKKKIEFLEKGLKEKALAIEIESTLVTKLENEKKGLLVKLQKSNSKQAILSERVTLLELDLRKQRKVSAEKFKIEMSKYQKKLANLESKLENQTTIHKRNVFGVKEKFKVDAEVYQGRIRQLEKSIQEKVAFYQKKIEGLEVKIAQTEDVIKKKELVYTKLSQQQEELNVVLTHKKDENIKFVKDVAHLRKQIKQEEDIFAGKLKNIQKPLKEKVLQLQNKITQLAQNNQQLVKRLSDRVENLQAIKGKLTEERKVTKDLLGDMEKLEKELQITKDSIPQLISKERGPLEKVIKNLKMGLDKKEIEIDNQITEKNELIQRMEKLTKELVFIQERLDQTEESIPQHIAKVQMPFEKREKALNINLTQLRGELQKKGELYDQLSQKYTAVFSKLQNKQEERDVLMQKLTKVTTQLEGTIQSIPEQILKEKTPLQASIRFLEKRLLNTENLLKKRNGEIDEFLNVQKAAKSQLDGTQQEKQELLKRISHLQKEMTGLKEDVPEQIKAAKVPLQGSIKKFQDRLEENQKIFKQKDEELVMKIKQNQDLKKALDKVKVSLVASNNDVEQMKAELQIVREGIPQKLKETKDPLLRNINVFKEELEKRQKMLTQKEDIVQTLNKKNVSLKDKIELLLNEKERLAKKIDFQKAQESTPEQISKIKKPLVAEIEKLTRKIEGYQRGLDKEEKMHQDMAKQYADLQDEHKKLQERNALLKEEKKNLDHLRAQQVTQAKQPFQKKIQSLNYMIKNKDKDYGTLDERYKRLIQVQGVLEKDYQNLEIQYKTLANEKEDFEKKISIEMVQVKSSLQKKMNQLQKDIVKKDEVLGKKDKEFKSFATKYETLEGRLSSIVEEKKSLERTIFSLNEQMKKIEESFPDRIQDAKKPLEDEVKRLTEALEEKDHLSTAKVMQVRNVLKKNIQNLEMALNEKERIKKQKIAKGKVLLEKKVLELHDLLKAKSKMIPVKISQAKQPLERKIKVLSETIKENEKSVNQKDQEIRDFVKKYKTLQGELKSNEKQKQNLMKEIEVSRNQLIGAQNKLTEKKYLSEEKWQEERIALLEKIKNWEEQAKSSKELITEKGILVKNLTTDKMDIENKLREMTVRRELMMEALKQIKKQKNQLEKTIPDQIKEAKAPLQSKLLTLKTQLKEIQSEVTDKNKNIEILQLSKERLELHLTEFNQDATKKSSFLNAQLTEAQDSYQRVEVLLKDKDKQIETLKNEGKLTRERLEHLQAERDTLDKKVQSFKQEIKNIKEAALQKDHLLMKSNEEIKKLNKIKNSIEEKLFNFRQSGGELNEKLDVLQGIQQKTMKLMRKKDDDLTRLREEVKGLDSELNFVVEERNILKGQIAKLSDKIKSIQMVEAEKIAVAIEPFQEKIINLEKGTQLLQNSSKIQLEDIQASTQRKLRFLEDEVKSKNILLSKKEKEVEQLISEKKKFDQEILFLKTSYKKLDTHLKSVEVDYEKELKNSNALIKGKDKEVKELKQALLKLEENMNRSEKEKTDLREKSSLVYSVQERVKISLEEAQLRNQNLQKERANIKILLKRLRTERTQLEKDNKALSQYSDGIKTSLEKKIRDLEIEKVELVKFGEVRVQDKTKALEQKIDSLEKKLILFKSLIGKKEISIKEIITERDLITKQLDTMSSKKNEAERRVNELMRQVKKGDVESSRWIKEEKKVLEKKIYMLEKELKNVILMADKKIKSHQVILKENIKVLQKKLNRTELIISEREVAISELLHEKENLKKESAKTQNAKNTMEEALQALMEQLKEVKKSVDDRVALARKPLQSKIEMLEKQLKNRNNESVAIQEKHKKLNDKLKSLTEQVKISGAQVKEKETRIDALSRQIVDTQRNLRGAEKLKGDLRLSLDKLKEKLKTSEAEMLERMIREKNPLISKIKQLEKRLLNKVSESRIKSKKGQVALKKEIQKLENEVASFKMIIDEKKSINNELQKNKDILADDLDVAKKRAFALQEEIYVLTDKIDKTKNDLGNQLQQERERNMQLEKRVSKSSELDTLKNEIQDALELIEVGK
ncbi:Exonuclease SbcC [hydrothermal vent metagenome]|uniref:Exonuclease SbcC n=1 Tax=hydrothermal vent metagenome TaxID=652676 RepID=A0A3B1DFW5_9ZZZZ